MYRAESNDTGAGSQHFKEETKMHYATLFLAFVTGIVGGSTVTYFRDRLSQFAKELTTRLFDWLDSKVGGGTPKAVIAVVMLSTVMLSAYSCHAQNGPTPPSVTLNWTQSTTAGVTANCVYKGTSTGAYSMPALFCSSSPITSYVDNSVTRGTKAFYAVTAKVGAAETPYSNEVNATPPVLNAPSALGTALITELFFPPQLRKGVETASSDGMLRAVAK